MKKYKVEVIRTDTYEIKLDENVLNEQWMNEFRQVFYNFHNLEDHAEHIAQFRARFGEKFIEGYGVPLENGKKPYWAEDNQVNTAININAISEDDDIEVYASEMK